MEYAAVSGPKRHLHKCWFLPFPFPLKPKLNLGASLKLLKQQHIKWVLSLGSFSEITVTLPMTDA